MTGSFAAALSAVLSVGSLTETLTVTGEAPTVDVQSVAPAARARFGRPRRDSGRPHHIDDALLLPGLLAFQPTVGSGNLVDVGGTNNLQIA